MLLLPLVPQQERPDRPAWQVYLREQGLELESRSVRLPKKIARARKSQGKNMLYAKGTPKESCFCY